MYFRVNLKMRKPTCCFTWIVFIFSSMSVNKEILGWEIVKAEGWKILRNGEILVMGDHFEIGELIPLYGL